MLKLIHISDPHIAPAGRKVMGMDPVRRLNDVVDIILREHADAVGCVVTGDLTDAGDLECYALFKDVASRLPMPVHLALGNHDRRDVFIESFGEVARDDAGYVQFTFDVGDMLCIVLDTLDADHAAMGSLCDERLAWLETTLCKNAGRPATIFMHHPPFPVGLDWLKPMLLRDDDAVRFREIVSAAGNVRHIAFGHVHIAYSGRFNGIPVSCSRGTCHKILDGSRAEMAVYEDAPPAFDLLFVSADGVRVERNDPAGTGRLIAREYATPDGKGHVDFLQEALT